MEPSTANQITTQGNQNFFLSPQFPMQRSPRRRGSGVTGGRGDRNAVRFPPPPRASVKRHQFPDRARRCSRGGSQGVQPHACRARVHLRTWIRSGIPSPVRAGGHPDEGFRCSKVRLVADARLLPLADSSGPNRPPRGSSTSRNRSCYDILTTQLTQLQDRTMQNTASAAPLRTTDVTYPGIQ